MIEIIQQTEKKEEKSEGRLPNNIRQIGNPEKDFRIYMEDYVYTYLHPAQIQGMEIVIVPRLDQSFCRPELCIYQRCGLSGK
ncbi:MAG: hypothetical protein BHW44_04885 [Roseburia sp. 40_7]|nr:MAG: hypothetical protein BHW44_04885 [Roseburia sp. 40_7]